jgi:superfamily II DNA or RNA helicase
MYTIRKEMGERFLTIGPNEIPGFPDEIKSVELVDLAKKDHDALVKAYEDMPDRIRKMSEDDMVKMLRLRQQAEFCKAEVMAQMAEELIEDGYSVFIMINFTDARLRIEEYFKKKGINYASIYGGQKEKERQAGIDAFQSNRIYAMVGMAAACSVALSLHDERHERARVSLISPGYSASEFSQGLGRIRRVGGTTAVQKIIIAADSVEGKVGRTIERKMNNLSALTDGDLMR